MNRNVPPSNRPHVQSIRALRWAAFAAVAIALLVVGPLPALGGSVAASKVSMATPHGAIGSVTPRYVNAVLGPNGQMARLTYTPLVASLFANGDLLGHPSVARTILSTTTAPHQFAARPSVLTGNQLLPGYCQTTSALTAVNGTNSTLFAGMDSSYLLFNTQGDTACNTYTISNQFVLHGALEGARSTDGGQSWNPVWIPQNASWTTTGTTTNGSVPGISLQSSLPFSSPGVASANDGTTLISTLFSEPCTIIFFAQNCSSTAAGFQAPAGVAVSRSTNGGASFVNTTVVDQTKFIRWFTSTPTCNATLPSGYYYLNFILGTDVAINPVNDVAIATWQDVRFHFNATACTFDSLSSIRAAVSANGGQSWSAARNITGVQSGNARVSIGPAPQYNITVAAQNYLNQSRLSSGGFTVAWSTVKSTNNGTTFGVPVDTALSPNFNVLWAPSTAPANFGVNTYPGFGVDSSPTSPYAGNTYLAWSDNQSGANVGYPAIYFQTLTAGSSTWGAQVSITPASLHSLVFFEPTLSISPDGTVWVTFYGENHASGNYGVYAIYSKTGGATWSQLGQVTTQASTPSSVVTSIGDYMGLAATSAGAYATWMDCRSNTCSSSDNTTVMDALIEPVALPTNGTGVNLTMTTNGAAQTFPLPNAIPLTIGTSHTVSAPGWLPHNATTVESFHNYSGAVNSTSFSVTFTYNGGNSLATTYTFQPGAFIAGTFTPNVPQSHLTIDGYVVPLTTVNGSTLSYNYSVASGRSYFINASASIYYSSITNHPIGVSPGATSFYNIVLGHTSGWLAGRVTPFNATLLVNGTPVAVNITNGVYNQTVGWGSYWVNASGFGVTNFSRYVVVSPSMTTTTSPILIGGWIKGTLGSSYPGVSIKVDGVAITNAAGVTFNDSYLGGSHEIVATAPGYNTTYINVSVLPAHTKIVAIALTNQGTVVGQVSPSPAAKLAQLTVNNISKRLGGHFPVDALGDFLVNLTGEVNYTVNVTAAGYSSFQTVVFVRPGHTTAPISITLSVQKPGPCTTNCPPPPGNNSNTTSSGGISLIEVAGILVVVVLVAAVAAVVLMRRRGGGGSAASAPPEGSTGGAEPAEGGETYGGSYNPPPPSG
ncbi:MAG: hypothetical protein L3K18_06955 [Thermoplasmata archaeon]|nr:hypothetical protein [Thermoplasmata archaeon]